MKTVLRYPLSTSLRNQAIVMPCNAKVLTIRKDSTHVPYICAIVDDENNPVERKFLVIKEGDDCQVYNRFYYGTFESGGENYFVFEGGMQGV